MREGFVTEENFFVLNADTFYEMDYCRLMKIKEENCLDMALVLRGVPDVTRYGEAVLDGVMLAGFNEKTGERVPAPSRRCLPDEPGTA